MIQIIPAIDIIEGKCVRLEKGVFATRKTYAGDPVEIAKRFADIGLKRLHLVDLDGACSGHLANLKVLERIAASTCLHIDFGGGIRTLNDVNSAFSAGASMVNIGSMAVKNPEYVTAVLECFGNEKIILVADVKNEKIAINGWVQDADLDLWTFLKKWTVDGIDKVCCTDVLRDGMLSGPAFDLYQQIKEKHPELFLIASGGISNINDIHKLNQNGINAVIIGKALYEERIRLNELTLFLR